MRAYKLQQIEERFDRELVDSQGKKFTREPGLFNYVDYIKSKNDSFYIKRKVDKVGIVWHGTAGVLPGDVAQLTTSSVSTAFVVARSGKVYQLFDPIYCAYHLGPSANYNNKEWSFKTIGIEVSNMLVLIKKGDVLLDAYGKEYCSLTDTQHYDHVEEPFRKYTYFAKFTDEQYSSLKKLTRDLCMFYGLPYTSVPLELRTKALQIPANRYTISSHVNWRSDKFDLPSTFDWDRAID